MLLLKLAFLFFIGSIIGWVIELFFRKFFASDNPKHNWVNPGFLVGPYLPMYGTGLCVLYLLSGIDVYFVDNVVLKKALLFVVMMVAMTVIEYITGLVFVKHMKVSLWDYSQEWGNLHGLICPRFSFFWALLGALYYFLVHPYMLTAVSWLSANLAFSFFIGLYYGIFIIDVAYSIRLMNKLKEFADKYDVVIRLEHFRQHMIQARENLTEKSRFIFSLKSGQQLSVQLDEFLKLTQLAKDRIAKINKKNN